MPIPDDIRNHLRKAGVARISANLFERELQPLFEKYWQWLYLEQQETVKALNVALEKERAVS